MQSLSCTSHTVKCSTVTRGQGAATVDGQHRGHFRHCRQFSGTALEVEDLSHQAKFTAIEFQVPSSFYRQKVDTVSTACPFHT